MFENTFSPSAVFFHFYSTALVQVYSNFITPHKSQDDQWYQLFNAISIKTAGFQDLKTPLHLSSLLVLFQGFGAFFSEVERTDFTQSDDEMAHQFYSGAIDFSLAIGCQY